MMTAASTDAFLKNDREKELRIKNHQEQPQKLKPPTKSGGQGDKITNFWKNTLINFERFTKNTNLEDVIRSESRAASSRKR
jgi:hypothetical protein